MNTTRRCQLLYRLAIMLVFCSAVIASCKHDDVTVETLDPTILDTTVLPVIVDTVVIPPVIVDTVVIPPVILDTIVVDPGPPHLVDSLVGTFTGTCYNYYRTIQNGQFIEIRDTTYDSIFRGIKSGENNIIFQGCGTYDGATWFLPIYIAPDTVISRYFHQGGFTWNLTIDFHNRSIKTIQTYNFGGGNTFQSEAGAWSF